MKTLLIEWKHLDVEGETCDRCYDTGENLAQEIKRLNRVLNPKDISVSLVETKLNDSEIPQSNALLFNEIPIEEILDIKVSENFCESCSTLLGSDTFCRTVIFEGNEYEDIPAKAIRQAAYKSLGIVKKETEHAQKNDCCCGDKCC